MAFLVVLESMTPAERVAFILHDVFRYAFPEIAEITGRTPAACRQLASSARRRLRVSRAPAVATAQQAGIVRDFKQAWETKDIAALVGLLDPDATMTADGGGLVSAVLHPIEGGEQIARAYVDISHAAPGLAIRERTVNGRPGLVSQYEGVNVTVFAFHIEGESKAIGSSTSGRYATRRSSAPGRAVDRHPSIGVDRTRPTGPGPS